MNKRILIVDDDRNNIFALSAVLSAKKFSPVGVTSVEDAFSKLEDGPPFAIVLMDMMMPGIDGYEAISALRNNELYHNLPVIAVTAQAMTGDKEKCLAAGANDYISKPVDIDVLLNILNRYIV